MTTFNVKRIYFTLDYLRLHKLGRTLKLFSKNRQMLDHNSAGDTKKGYKAYIHRMYHTFLKKDFDYITVIKPRNEFGYNFGLTDAQLNSNSFLSFNMFENTEKLLLYMFRRFLIYGDYKDKVNNYIRAFENNKFVKPRTKKIFYTVRLDPEKSCGYEAMKELYKVRDAHFDLLNEFKNEKEAIEQCIKSSLVAIFNKLRKVKQGQEVFLFNNQGAVDTTRTYKVERVLERRDGLSKIERVDLVLNNGPTKSITDVIPVFKNQSEQLIEKLKENQNLKQAFYDYVITKLETAQNLELLQIFNFAKSFYKIQFNCTEDQKEVIDSFELDDFKTQLTSEELEKFNQPSAATREYVDFLVTSVDLATADTISVDSIITEIVADDDCEQEADI